MVQSAENCEGPAVAVHSDLGVFFRSALLQAALGKALRICLLRMLLSVGFNGIPTCLWNQPGLSVLGVILKMSGFTPY